MELHDALSQIADIHLQMARTRLFRGYRSSTTLFSADVAVIASVVQAIFLPEPARHLIAYLTLWFGSAGFCILLVGSRIGLRYLRSDSPLERQLTLWAVQQFIPCILIGAALTYVIAQVSWGSLWIAPGLWAILFGMGFLASRQLLPSGITWVSAFYVLCGLLSIEWARTHSPFSPWSMAIPFGFGQMFAAAVLYWKLERNDAAE